MSAGTSRFDVQASRTRAMNRARHICVDQKQRMRSKQRVEGEKDSCSAAPRRSQRRPISSAVASTRAAFPQRHALARLPISNLVLFPGILLSNFTHERTPGVMDKMTTVDPRTMHGLSDLHDARIVRFCATCRDSSVIRGYRGRAGQNPVLALVMPDAESRQCRLYDYRARDGRCGRPPHRSGGAQFKHRLPLGGWTAKPDARTRA